ncbi:hypothetical protein THAOC_10605, partial [Thalassiosira oceanica]
YDSRRISSGPVGHIPGYEAGCRAHSHAPTEGVARRGFDCPEMTAYGDGLGARGSLPLPLGLDSLYCGDTFYIYTDASDYQLGAVIMQHDDDGVLRPPLPTRLPEVWEKGQPAMLYGADPQIYTDHKNLIFANFTTQRVLRWRCFIEEFHPQSQTAQ